MRILVSNRTAQMAQRKSLPAILKHTEPHSYIVRRDQLGGFPLGALVEWKEDGYNYHSHSGAVDLSLAGIHSAISKLDLAALTEKECLILDAISSEAIRFAVHSTPGKLKWAVGLKIGATVLARLPEKSDGSSGGKDVYATAVIKWIGLITVRFGEKHYYGVEIKVC